MRTHHCQSAYQNWSAYSFTRSKDRTDGPKFKKWDLGVVRPN